MFEKIRTIRVSERVLDLVVEKLKDLNENREKDKKLDGWLETFNNCREQGFVLVVCADTEKQPFVNTYIWACEQRVSDDIVIYMDKESRGTNNMITEDAYKKAKYIKCDDYIGARDYIVEKILEIYGE